MAPIRGAFIRPKSNRPKSIGPKEKMLRASKTMFRTIAISRESNPNHRIRSQMLYQQSYWPDNVLKTPYRITLELEQLIVKLAYNIITYCTSYNVLFFYVSVFRYTSSFEIKCYQINTSARDTLTTCKVKRKMPTKNSTK